MNSKQISKQYRTFPKISSPRFSQNSSPKSYFHFSFHSKINLTGTKFYRSLLVANSTFPNPLIIIINNNEQRYPRRTCLIKGNEERGAREILNSSVFAEFLRFFVVARDKPSSAVKLEQAVHPRALTPNSNTFNPTLIRARKATVITRPQPARIGWNWISCFLQRWRNPRAKSLIRSGNKFLDHIKELTVRRMKTEALWGW